MTHWIAFPRPPTAAEVYSARQQGYKGGGEWASRTYPVARPRRQVNSSPTSSLTTAPARDLVQADMPMPYDASAAHEEEPDFERAWQSYAEEGVPEADRQLFDHAHDLARRVEWQPIDTTTDESSMRDGEGRDPDLHCESDLAPPPAQKRKRSSQPALSAVDFSLDLSRDSDDVSRAPTTAGPSFLDHSRFTTTRTDDSYEQTFRSQAGQVGGAPELPFRKRQLVPLNELHAIRDPNHLVSVLATVWSIQERDTSRGRLSEWSLVDSSGYSCPFSRWLNDYSADAEQVRLGDVIFLHSISVGSWRDKPQLKFRRNSTEIKICWRTRVFDPEDAAYRFHRAWASEIPEAAAVIKEADAAEAKLL